MNRRNAAQSVSEYALDSFKQKAKTPTIGGLVFLLVPLVSFIFYKHYRFDNPHLNLLLITFKTGAKQFVVQLAPDIILSSEVNMFSLTPNTIVLTSSFAGADIITFFAPAFI